MSKKLFTLIIVVVLALVGIVAWRIFNTPAAKPVAQTPDAGTTNLFPFGQGAVNTSGKKPVVGGANQSTTTVVDLSNSSGVARLRRLSPDPSTGGSFIQTSSTSEAFRFVNRATGHITEAVVDSNTQSKISNVTIPQIRETLWDSSGKSLIYRYLKDGLTIQSFYAFIKGTAASSTQPIEGLFLPTDIRSLALVGGKFLYFDPTVETGRLILANADGSKKAIVWTSSFGDWTISSTNPAKAFVYPRASGTANGTGYIIDTAKFTATKVVGDIAGLEGIINPSGDYVFLSAAENSTIASASYSTAKKATLPLTLATLASKCAWSNTDKKMIYCAVPAGITSGTYPDDWYKGSISFSDRLWKINMETGETSILLDPFIDSATNYDMTNLVVDPADAYLSFVNKRDSTVWLYSLK